MLNGNIRTKEISRDIDYMLTMNWPVSHTFTSPGNYTVQLEVSDDLGATDRETLTIAVTSPTALNTPPTAVISSSAGLGAAPLTVNFDGSDSTDSDGTIVQYQWDMGDGSTASGPQSSHTYITPGTFSATLSVIDNGGLTDTISTPVLVNLPQQENSPPTALIATDNNEGVVPLAVGFDASESQDSDGSIVLYAWNFGDGTTDTAIAPNHIYTYPGIFTITLDEVTDDWQQVVMQSPIPGTPHCFASMQSYDGSDNAALRYDLQNSSDLFIFVEEEQSRDNELNHTTETVGYMTFGKN